MKALKYFLSMVLVIAGTGCSNTEEVEILLEETPIESVVKSRSTEIDNPFSELLEAKTIMPRVAESYQGYIMFENYSYPVSIYWDFEVDNYNLFAIIQGWSEPNFDKRFYLSHFSTKNSASNTYGLDFVIKCTHSEVVLGELTNTRYVTFHLTYYPSSQNCVCEVLEIRDTHWPLEEFD